LPPADCFLLEPAAADGAPPRFAQRDNADGSLVALLGPGEAGTTARYAVAPAALDLPAREFPRGGVTLETAPEALSLRVPEGLVGAYRFGGGAARPFLWPLLGPGQTPVTRAYPMAEREGEARDHPHHRSLWSAYGDVNGVDDWSEEEGHGTITHQAFVRQGQGPVFGGFTAGGLWRAPDGEPLLREERTIRAYNVGGDRRLLDYTLTLVADQGRDIVFGDTKEGGLLSVRVATTMDGARGGTIENAGGGRGEAACWGKPSPWCDYSGRVEDQIVGIALLDHPSNPGHPARWHVRDYGLMTANPFATGAFTGGAPTPVTLPRDLGITFRYRVLLHRGGAAEGQVADAYHAFTDPPAATIYRD
jgi:hypothetical protein